MKQEILDLIITENARQYPQKTAVKSENRSISYGELEINSNRIANFMHRKIEEIPHVVILMDRSILLIESIIGILKCELVFVPISPSLPQNRIKTMIRESRAQWVISETTYYKKFSDIFTCKVEGKDEPQFKTLLIDQEGNHPDIEPSKNLFLLPSGQGDEELLFERTFNKNCYIYFTSGSTGIPKGVLGRQTSLLHFIRWEIEEFGVHHHFKISQLTPPSFDPFLRDIFVPLMTGATLCIPSNDTLLDMEKLVRWIDDNEITLIHTVPSLFKSMVNQLPETRCFHHLKYILLAGELLRGRDIHRFIEVFNDRISLVNVYGPTETTLAKLFYRIKPEDKDRAIIPVGKPIKGAQVMILDRKKQKCRMGKKGEIYIRTPFISSGYYNDSILNEKVFIKNPYGKHPQDIIYKTGDLGRILPDGNLEITGRVDFQVKIRGMRVELGEIENCLLMHPYIHEAIVITRERENTEKYLCAYVISNKKLETATLRNYLSESLPEHMIPNFFIPLEKMPLTSSGKIDRRALPEPGIDDNKSYEPPRNPLEEQLVNIWSQQLGLDKKAIGIEANFFELGGHSLKASAITAQIHKTLNVRVPLAELFKSPTIKGLSARIKELELNKYTSIKLTENKEYYPLSPAQKRLYILQQMDLTSTAYNIPMMVGLEGEIDKQRVRTIFKYMLQRHEALCTSFHMINNEAWQKIHPETELDIRFSTIHESQPQKTNHPFDSHYVNEFLQPFNLSQAPLFRIAMIKLEEKKYILMTDIHHIISDGISMHLMMKEFTAIYLKETLLPLRLRYRDFSCWQQELLISGEIQRQEKFWLETFKGEIPRLNMPLDYPRPAVKTFAGDKVSLGLGKELTTAIIHFNKENGITLFMLLLAVYQILLHKYTGQTDIVVGSPVSGRGHVDLENLLGVFVNMIATRNRPAPEKSFIELLGEVKDVAAAAFDNQEYPFEELITKLGLQGETNRNPLFDMGLVLQNTASEAGMISVPQKDSLKVTQYDLGNRGSRFDMLLTVIENSQEIEILLEYSTHLFKPSSAQLMCTHYKEILEQGIDNKEAGIKDITISSYLKEIKSSPVDLDFEI